MPPRADPIRTEPDPADLESLADERYARAGEFDEPPLPFAPYLPQVPPSPVYASFEQLRAALPPGAGNAIEPDGEGGWRRWVVRHTGDSVTIDDELYYDTEQVPRAVALSRAEAEHASASGVETDWWSGYTWFRRGYKPEKDLVPVRPRASTRRGLEKTSPVDQARARQAVLRQQAHTLIPEASDEQRDRVTKEN